jgi:uncharacterized protein DUF3854
VLADWEYIALKERWVYIGFDSDVMQKPDVHSALSRLKSFLESRGATVRPIYLPPGERGEKVGIDDFIAREKAVGRSDAEIRDTLGALAACELRKQAIAPSGRPKIIVSPGRIPEIVDQAERALVENATRLRMFQRAGEVARVVALDRPNDRSFLRRPQGAVQLAAVTAVSLQETVERLVEWVKVDSTTGDEKPADCPLRVPLTYLSRVGAGDCNMPVLVGVVEAPIMRPDGSILNTAGYDESTGLYLDAGDWPFIPDAPTRADAQAGVRELLGPFAEFPFVDEAAKSVLLAALLTAIQRRLLETAPLFGFSAPTQRSGKSLLAESIGVIATGRKPAATGVASKDDELRKAITSALREGQAVVNLDNITHPLGSPDLARAITQSVYQDRLLGVNKMLSLPTNVLWTATGNNLTFPGDLPSRALLCRIDSRAERPEERAFKIVDLPGYLLTNRKRLIGAALTVLRAYHVAGRPRQNVRPWGGFDHWSRDIREPLVWLGLADAYVTRERIIVNDPERDFALDVLCSWYEFFAERPMPVGELIREASPELKEQLLAVAASRNDPLSVDARRLGAWCRSVEDRIFGDFQLCRAGSVHRATAWRVSCVSSVSSKGAGHNNTTRAHSVGDGRAETVCASPSSDGWDTNSPNSSGHKPEEDFSLYDEDPANEGDRF